MKARSFGWGYAMGLLAAMGCGGAQTPAPAGPSASSAPQPTAQGTAAQPVAPSGPDVERAILSIKAGDFRSAKAGLEVALTKNPKNATAVYYLGVALENLGDKSGAEQRYREALALSPDIVEAAVNLGAICIDGKKYDEAIAVTQKGLARRPDDPALHANMAFALLGKGDKTGALAEFDRSVRVVGDNAGLRLAYGELLLETGNKAKAAGELHGALAAAGSDRAMLASIARLLGAAGAFADCVSGFDKAIAAGDDAELRVRRGVCRHELKDEPGAKSDFEAAIKLSPKFAPAHYYLGQSLLAAGNAAQAAKEFEAAAAAGQGTELGKRAKEQAQAARKQGTKK